MVLGSIVGGFLNDRSARKTNRANKHAMQNRISWTVADAKRAGVSPLAALGSPASGGFIPAQQSNAGSIVGSGIDSAIAQRQNREFNDLQKEKAKAEIENIRANTAAVNTATSRTNAAASANAIRSGGDPIAAANAHTVDKAGLNKFNFPKGQVTAAVGPDISELATGAIMNAIANMDAREQARVQRKHEIATGKYRSGPPTRPTRRQAKKIGKKMHYDWQRGYHNEWKNY